MIRWLLGRLRRRPPAGILVLDAPLLWVPDMRLETFGVQPPEPAYPTPCYFEAEMFVDIDELDRRIRRASPYPSCRPRDEVSVQT